MSSRKIFSALPSFLNRAAPASHVIRAYPPAFHNPQKPITTMSDWKAPMTKLVNQIYSKADAGTYFYVCILLLKFPAIFSFSCRTSYEGSGGRSLWN